MAGFLGGSSGSGTGGEIQFPAEFIDPVTKLRVSEPETLIDTDFEYGLQPTKWETVELINNTPSFFSKSGDTTINGITAMVTTQTSREIKVTTSSDHGLAVGIPINVSGSKSITADGSYIINSIPDSKTFTYLAKQNQDTTASIFDLYTSIITGEFFQGSQIKISDSQGIVTNAANPSALTVQTDSPHGFQVGSPFYFLNLNSTVSQLFDASNTGAKTFDSSNSATAQTFDGSNTAITYSIDLTNKALLGGTTSSTQTHSAANKTITVLHSTETFVGKAIGQPLYYNVTAASGYFNTYPRGIVYLATNGFNTLGASTSTFSVASTPGGDLIDIPSYPSGTFQLATNASFFAGNNTDTTFQTSIPVSQATATPFDGANSLGSLGTVNTYSGTIIQVNNDAGTTISPNLYVTAMVLYTTTGANASGLTNNTTYFVTYYNEPAGASVPGFFQIKVAATPGGADISVSGGTGTQKFRKIGVSIDKDYFHVPGHGLTSGDLVRYSYPAGGAVAIASNTKDYFFVESAPDVNNLLLSYNVGISATGGTVTPINVAGTGYKVHKFDYTTTGATQNFVVSGAGNVEYLIVAGGGGGGIGNNQGYESGGGGGGGVVTGTIAVTSQTYPIVVGNGGNSRQPGVNGGNSTAFGKTALGGGGGGTGGPAGGGPFAGQSGGSGGGGAHAQTSAGAGQQPGSASGGFGNAGGFPPTASSGGGGGGAGQAGNVKRAGDGGDGIISTITGSSVYYAGGGGANAAVQGIRGLGGLGGGGNNDTGGLNAGYGQQGTDGLGGGGGASYRSDNAQVGGSETTQGRGGHGVVIVRYQG
jgi:hypothetical protein